MIAQVHPATTMLRGDGNGYNPRDISLWNAAEGCEMVEGVFRDDGRTDGGTPRPEIPFNITLPPAFNLWQALNAKIYYELQSGSPRIFINAKLPF